MSDQEAEPANSPFDPENPEWTAADFRRAQPFESLPSDVLAAFPRTKAKLQSRKP